MSDVKCRACEAKLPIVWHKQLKKDVHLNPWSLSTTSCEKLEAIKK